MKKRILLNFLLLNIFCAFAQEKQFIINGNIKDVSAKVSNFQSAISNDISDASFSDTAFETEIVVKNEEYNSDLEGNYLQLKFNKPLLITSYWNVVLNQINSTQTKVSITLAKAVSNNKILKKDQVVSNGKIEKNLNDYINDELNNNGNLGTESVGSAPTESKVQSLGKGIELFEKNNYSIQYPKKWEMKSPGPFLEPFCLMGPKEEEYVYINLIKEEDSKQWQGKNFKEYIENQIQLMRSDACKITKNEQIEDTSYKIEFESMIGDEIFKSIRYFYLVDNDIYLLTFCATDIFFNAYLKQGEAIIKTFKINNELKNIKQK